jgi:hypothetical protein
MDCTGEPVLDDRSDRPPTIGSGLAVDHDPADQEPDDFLLRLDRQPGVQTGANLRELIRAHLGQVRRS